MTAGVVLSLVAAGLEVPAPARVHGVSRQPMVPVASDSCGSGAPPASLVDARNTPAIGAAIADHQEVPASDGQSDSFGSSLAVGDFTGDGKGDLAIGAPTYQGTVGAVETLQSTGTGALVSFMNGVLWTHHVAGDDFGRSLAVGDFTGTGVDQLAIGAPGQGGFGAVSLIQGTTQPTLTTVTSGLSLLGDVALGTTLAAGDFNGDGKDGLAIGDPRGTVDGGDLGPTRPWPAKSFSTTPSSRETASKSGTMFSDETPGIQGTAVAESFFGAAAT